MAATKVALMLCDQDEAERLESLTSSSLQGGLATTRSTKWQGGYHLTFMVVPGLDGPAIDYVGRASRDRRVSTGKHLGEVNLKRGVVVDNVRRFRPGLPLSDVAARLRRPFTAAHLEYTTLPPIRGEAVLDAILGLRPSFLADIDSIMSSGPLQLPLVGHDGDMLLFHREAVGGALAMSGFSRDVLAEARLEPERLEGAAVPFLKALPRTPHEDVLIGHDSRHFRAWSNYVTSSADWRVFEQRGQRLFIGNVDTYPEETKLGVDLIYYHEDRGAFILVQYKKLERARNKKGDWGYRPNTKMRDQLERMKAVDDVCEKLAKGTDDFRLYPGPTWIKLCEGVDHLPTGSDLVAGMYLPRKYFAELCERLDGQGERNGTVFAYYNVPRYLTNTMFSDLVADGWIGSTGVGSEVIGEQINISRQKGHDVLLAVLQGEKPYQGSGRSR